MQKLSVDTAVKVAVMSKVILFGTYNIAVAGNQQLEDKMARETGKRCRWIFSKPKS